MADTSRVLGELQASLVTQWTTWIARRAASAPSVSRPTLERELDLMITVLGRMIGSHRHEATPIWVQLAEHYGRVGATRGLAAGEVVEELQYLRELLIVELAPRLWRGRPRQGLAITMRLNRILDRAVAVAVVGYTDMLVATLFAHNGVPAASSTYDAAEVSRQLDEFARDVEGLTAVT